MGPSGGTGGAGSLPPRTRTRTMVRTTANIRSAMPPIMRYFFFLLTPSVRCLGEKVSLAVKLIMFA